MRLRYFYCRRHIGFFQQLFRGLENLFKNWGLGTREEAREQGAGSKGEEFSPPPPAPRPSASFQCPMPQTPCPNSIFPYLIVELFGKLYPQLIGKAQSQLPLAAFL